MSDISLEKIEQIKKEKETHLKQLDKILEKISSLRSKIESAHRLYSSKAAKNNRSYGYGMSNLASNRTTLSEVWEALYSYNQIKEDIEPLLEKEKMKKKSLDLRIEKKDEVIEKIEEFKSEFNEIKKMGKLDWDAEAVVEDYYDVIGKLEDKLEALLIDEELIFGNSIDVVNTGPGGVDAPLTLGDVVEMNMTNQEPRYLEDL